MSKHQIYKTIIVSALAMLVPLVASAQDISDWRVPTQSELSDKLGWRKENPNLYVTAKADFDGDGQEDVARLLINDKKNKMGLIRLMGSNLYS